MIQKVQLSKAPDKHGVGSIDQDYKCDCKGNQYKEANLLISIQMQKKIILIKIK